jgi:hypothetical protein
MGSLRRPFGDCDPWEARPSRGTIDAMTPRDPLHATRRWLPSGRLARRTRGPLLGGLWLRVLTKWRAADLDRRLAAGADPMQRDELSLRAGQLGSAGTRSRLAAALREAVAVANGRHAPLISTRLQRPEIRENEDLLLALADRLSDGEPLGVEGLAKTARLVDDRSSPMYRAGGTLPEFLSAALTALERGHRTAGSAGR